MSHRWMSKGCGTHERRTVALREKSMTQKEDEKFVGLVTNSQSRKNSIRGWRRSRMFASVASGCSFLAAITSFTGSQGALCGLFAGVAAINFAVALSADLKIKIALLADECRKD